MSVQKGDTIDQQISLVETQTIIHNPANFIQIKSNCNSEPFMRYGVLNDQLYYQLYNIYTHNWQTPIYLFNGTNPIYQAEKGSTNGVCPLNNNTMIDDQYLPIRLYKGLQSQVILPGFYDKPPVIGSIFITSDTLQILLLSNSIYTNILNWNIIAYSNNSDVLSVNGKTGNLTIYMDELTAQNDVNLSNHKLINLAKATNPNDSVRFEQLTQNYFFYAYTNNNLDSLTNNYILPFDRYIEPESINTTNVISYDNITNGFNLLPGIYKIDFKITVQYQISTQSPVSFVFMINDVDLTYTITQCDNTDNFDYFKANQESFVVKNTINSQLFIKLLMDPVNVHQIGQGTSIFISLLQLF